MRRWSQFSSARVHPRKLFNILQRTRDCFGPRKQRSSDVDLCIHALNPCVTTTEYPYERFLEGNWSGIRSGIRGIRDSTLKHQIQSKADRPNQPEVGNSGSGIRDSTLKYQIQSKADRPNQPEVFGRSTGNACNIRPDPLSNSSTNPSSPNGRPRRLASRSRCPKASAAFVYPCVQRVKSTAPLLANPSLKRLLNHGYRSACSTEVIRANSGQYT
jgi:hypothetical protein